MGHSRKRVDAAGRVRWTAYYDDARRRRRSAGTFSRRKQADQAWQEAEALGRTGRPGDPRAGRITFADYVNLQWFPHHVLEPSTRESYRYYLNRHLIPWFGKMRMAEILPAHVREWVSEMSEAGMSPATIRQLKIILSTIFTTALNDYVTVIHACRGVKSPTVPIKEFRIVTPAEYRLLYRALPGEVSRLLIETDIGSGLRWGELSELRTRDLDTASCILTVSRAVVELNPKFHPDAGRFHVKPYPKSKRSRRFKLDPDLVAALVDHIAAHHLGPEDLLFTLPMFQAEIQPRPTLIDVTNLGLTDLGLTDPNPAGRRYRHGTMTAYTAARCRCPHCRGAVARYRAERRAHGLDSPRGTRPRDTDEDGHLPREWHRYHVWHPACDQAGLTDPRPRLHDLRHSHASWLLAGGADLQVVKERMGHGSIVTTEKYLHTLPTADETALAALRRIRHQ